MLRPPAQRNLSYYAQKYWHVLTAPSELLHNPAQRRQAQFLAAVVTVLMPVVLITSIYQDVSLQNGILAFKPAFAINITSVVIGAIIYRLSRTRHYQVAAYLTVFTASSAIFTALFAARTISVQSLSFLILPILLSSILLSARSTIVILLIHIAATFGFAFLHPEYGWAGMLFPSIRLQLFAGITILLGMYFRSRLDHDQNLIIRQNEQKLLQTNEELEKGVVDRTLAYQLAAEELIELLAERENYERELAKERNLLRTVIDNVPDHIFVLDRAGNYILVNKALALNMVKGDAEALMGKNVLDLSPNDQAAGYFANEKSIMETGQPKLNIEQTSLEYTGPQRHFVASKIPLHDPNDEIIGLVGIAHDVTDRKETEKRLQQSYAEMENRVIERTAELSLKNVLLQEYIIDREAAEGQLRYQASLLENVSDAIISVDNKFVIRSWNKAAETMYGWTEAEAIGNNAFKMTGANLSVDMIDDLMRQTMSIGHWRGETTDKRRDGTKINVLASLTILKDARGEVQGSVLVNRDVTERKQVEAAEHEQRLLAEALRDTSAAISSTLKLGEILDSIL
ncbi:MAG: PAS domain S-box protein, partial [Chloroflexota bacterium]